MDEQIQRMADIVILSWHRADKTIECLQSIYRNTQYPFNIIIIDQGSSDHDIKLLEAYCNGRDNIRIYKFGENLGVGGGRKFGVQHSSADYIVFLDNDMVVQKNWLTELVRVAEENENILVVAINILYDGSPQKTLARRLGLVHGGATLYKRKAFAEAYLDEKYHIGCEDLDFMLQLSKKGFDMVIASNSRADHYPDIGTTYAQERRNNDIKHKAFDRFKKKWGINMRKVEQYANSNNS